MEKYLKNKLPGGIFKDVSITRSKTMRAIKGKGNLSTELRLRMLLIRSSINGWKLHPKRTLGNPDFFFPDIKVAVFSDGCFWHGCPKCGHIPKTNNEYWNAKILRNQQRDSKNNKLMKKEGIKVIRFWEHELKNHPDRCVLKLLKTIGYLRYSNDLQTTAPFVFK